MDATDAQMLLAHGAHLALVERDTKRAFVPGWPDTPASAEDVLRHVNAGGRVSVIPASLGMAVVDVDQARPTYDALAQEVQRRCGAAPAERTASGKWHLWYRLPAGRHTRVDWGFDGQKCGELLMRRCLSVVYDPAVVLYAMYHEPPVLNVSALELSRPQVVHATPRTHEGPGRLSVYDVWAAWSRLGQRVQPRARGDAEVRGLCPVHHAASPDYNASAWVSNGHLRFTCWTHPTGCSIAAFRHALGGLRDA